jgi:hypothetical protein
VSIYEFGAYADGDHATDRARIDAVVTVGRVVERRIFVEQIRAVHEHARAFEAAVVVRAIV